jgi:hypothetical protein
MEKRFVFLLGGACVGTGIATAACSDGFGIADKDGKKITESHGDGEESALMATEAYDQLGYDGLDNLHWDGLAFLALLLFFGGVGILVSANRNIWKQTGGY